MATRDQGKPLLFEFILVSDEFAQAVLAKIEEDPNKNEQSASHRAMEHVIK